MGIVTHLPQCLSYLFLFLKNQNLFSALEKAKHFLLKSVDIREESLTGIKRQFNVVKIGDLFYVLPRTMIVDGNPLQQKLILTDVKSSIGRSVLLDCHNHAAGLGTDTAKMFQTGIYVIGHRRFLRKLQQDCHTCRKIRKTALSSIMGGNWQLQGIRHCPCFSCVYLDPVGFFKLDLGDDKVGKVWLCTISCIWSRFTLFIVLESMSSDSILRAIKMAGYQTGGQVRIIHTDHANNLLSFFKLDDNDTEMDDVKLYDQLQRTLHKNNIILKPATSKSPWRVSLAESCQALLKRALKRSGYYQKKFTLGEWYYIAAKMSSQVNSRVLNVSYQEDSFITITPSSYMYGLKKADWPMDINLDDKNEKLFGRVQKLDKELQLLQNEWYKSYYHRVRMWTKWTKRTTLKEDDCVMILDRVTPSGTPQMGLITKVLSDRTYQISYISREAKMDKDTFKITKSAKKGILYRPVNQLSLISSKDECQDVNMEFLELEKTKADGKNYPLQDEFLGEDTTYLNDPITREEEIDDNLADMIVQGKPREVIDEFATEADVAVDTRDEIIGDNTGVVDTVEGDKPELVQGDQAVGEQQGDEPDVVQEDQVVVEQPVDQVADEHTADVQPEHTVNQVKNNPVIVNVEEDDNVDQIMDITSENIPPIQKRGRPKGKRKRRKHQFY